MHDLDHELIDAGDGRRLDRFGARLVDRPAPGASLPRHDPGAWGDADARFTPGGWFAGPGLHSPRIEDPDPWPITMGPVVMDLQFGSSGQVGLYPEHALGLPWCAAQASAARAERSTILASGAPGPNDPVRILNLFAHTGLATLVLAADGVAVTHVDASRPAVALARRNADRSGLADAPIRWIVDDAVAFTRRESRRDRTYDGVIVDPPSYGHAGTRTWRLEERLDELLKAVVGVLDPGRAFVLLTSHTTGIAAESLRDALAAALRRPERQVESGRLTLVARSGARLDGGAFARAVVSHRAMREDAER